MPQTMRMRRLSLKGMVHINDPGEAVAGRGVAPVPVDAAAEEEDPEQLRELERLPTRTLVRRVMSLRQELCALRSSTESALQQSWDEVEVLQRQSAGHAERADMFERELAESRAREGRWKDKFEDVRQKMFAESRGLRVAIARNDGDDEDDDDEGSWLGLEHAGQKEGGGEPSFGHRRGGSGDIFKAIRRTSQELFGRSSAFNRSSGSFSEDNDSGCDWHLPPSEQQQRARNPSTATFKLNAFRVGASSAAGGAKKEAARSEKQTSSQQLPSTMSCGRSIPKAAAPEAHQQQHWQMLMGKELESRQLPATNSLLEESLRSLSTTADDSAAAANTEASDSAAAIESSGETIRAARSCGRSLFNTSTAGAAWSNLRSAVMYNKQHGNRNEGEGGEMPPRRRTRSHDDLFAALAAKADAGEDNAAGNVRDDVVNNLCAKLSSRDVAIAELEWMASHQAEMVSSLSTELDGLRSQLQQQQELRQQQNTASQTTTMKTEREAELKDEVRALRRRVREMKKIVTQQAKKMEECQEYIAELADELRKMYDKEDERERRREERTDRGG